MKSQMHNIIRYIEPYSDVIKAKLENRVKSYLGHEGSFDDDVWVYKNHANYKKSSESDFCFRFLSVPLPYKIITKYFILRDLRSPGTSEIRIVSLHQFFRFILEKYHILNLNDLNYNILEDYRNHLEKLDIQAKNIKDKWNYLKHFFDIMSDFDEVPRMTFPADPNYGPIKRKKSSLKEDNELPKEVFLELDRVLLGYRETIPIHFQCVYWTLRLIPSRINEVLDMYTDTALRSINNEIKITIPVPKPSTDLDIIEKIVSLTGESKAEEFLINLLEQQREVSLGLQDKVRELGLTEGLLYTALKTERNHTKILESLSYSKVILGRFTEKDFHRWLTRIMKKASTILDEQGNNIYNLFDEEGVLYHITSHDFRHEGITNRLDYGFVSHKVMFLAGLVTEDTLFDYYTSRPNTVVQSEPIYKTTYDIKSPEEKVIRATDIIGDYELMKNVASTITFQGNSDIDEIILNYQVEIENHTPIITNKGHYLGNCPNFYACSKIKKELKCIGCEKSKDEISENGIEYIDKALAKYESDIKFYKTTGNIRMMKIAETYYERFKKQKQRLTMKASEL